MRLLADRFQKIPWYLKPFFWNQKRKYGQHLELAKVWASVPQLFLSVASIVDAGEKTFSCSPDNSFFGQYTYIANELVFFLCGFEFIHYNEMYKRQ